MAVTFHAAFALATTPPLLHHLDAAADPEVADALLGFLCDPIDPAMDAGIDGFLDLSPADPDDAADVDDLQPCAKRPRAGCGGDDGVHAWLDFEGVDARPWRPEFATEFVLPLPPPPPEMPHAGFVRGADARRAEGNGRVGQTPPSAAARERRRRISEKTAELSRLVPGGHRLNTAEMLQEAGRHVKLLQAQVGVLALMRTLELEEKIVPPVARERMHALLSCGGVQERLAAEGKCLVPMKLVEAMAEDEAITSNALLIRDLTRFSELLPEQ
ncbi:hypothetical protein ZWY2020_035227 [Hordeum vulgare]|nr:hypothetical protein ZWY2020_035227 [Hordeum vulgare]